MALPKVSEQHLMEFLETYDISSPVNDPSLTERIEQENPQIHRLLATGMRGAPSREAATYYEMGMQIVYRLLEMASENPERPVDRIDSNL